MKVYQTWISEEMPDLFYDMHYTWTLSQYITDITYDPELYNDMIEYCEYKEDYGICDIYNNSNKIEKIDIWRYVKIYMNGGIYSDMDIGINEVGLFDKANEYDMVVCRESPTIEEEPLLFMKHAIRYVLKLTDRPRLYQLRQSIFYGVKNSKILEDVIKKIIENDENSETLERTGPGVFTDIVIKRYNVN